MRCDRALIIAFASSLLATGMSASDMRVFTGAVLVERGQAAPVVELLSVGENGLVRRLSLSGWTIAVSRDAPVEYGRRRSVTFSVTPYNAHSSRHIYVDGERARQLEFDDAALAARAGYRIWQSEHASTEAAVTASKEFVGKEASRELRDRWRLPYAGVQLTQTGRFVTAEDPYSGRIEGFDVSGTIELYAGKKAWSRTTVLQSAGAAAGRLHFRQQLALMYGTNLDTVNAFLPGGSWDVIGPEAVYGTRYAEFRVNKGAILGGGADYAIGAWELGVRGSVIRAPSLHASGRMFQVARRVAGIHYSAAVGTSRGHTTFALSASAATFRP